MQGVGSNFSFLSVHSPQLAKLGALAERYFLGDPPSSLVKLRQFAEFTAKEIAARHALLPSSAATFDEVLRVLKARSVMPAQASDYFHHLRKVGNAAAHEDAGTAHEASLLARAFRGELVPQDPTDEPASELLARIRAQRDTAPKPKRGYKAKTSGD